MRRTVCSIALGALCVICATVGHASQATQPMNVSLTIVTQPPEVSLVVSALSFSGAEYGLGNTEITVNAPLAMAYIISLDHGVHAAYGDAVRHLGNGPTLLRYQLYRDPDRLFLWGDGTFLGQPVYGTGVGLPYTYAVYGRTDVYSSVSGGLPDGTYTDVVTVKVDF